MRDDWIGWLRATAPREPAALVSVLATEGSAPRGAGTRMLVTAGATRGTIGGGALELRATEQARAILSQPPGAWRVQDYPLGPLLGQCCGGRVRLLVEHVAPDALDWTGAVTPDATLVSTLGEDRVDRRVDEAARGITPSARGERPGVGTRIVERIDERARPLYLFGAGHVGQAIARHLPGLPLRLAWFDTRAELAALDGVTIVSGEALPGCVADAPEDAAIVILTHDHALDYALVRAALARPPAAFTGLIGSATKRARFLSRLRGEGVAADALARLTGPIGVGGVTGKEPDVIAIATLAQLLALGPAA